VNRNHWLTQIQQLDPATEYEQIYRIMATHEFPWDLTQSLSFALFRTYAVPSIGALLARTGEFTTRTQKRYDDTVLILDAILEHGAESDTGRSAIRRMNQMHGAYGISNDDLRYVLATFVVVPIRWLDDYGWRPLSETEKVASANYYRQTARYMGIKDIPATHQEFAALMDDYEQQHFAWDPGAREVADATLRLMVGFQPRVAARLVEVFSRGLMDPPLLAAFRYPAPSKRAVRLSRAALRARGRVERFLPPRRRPRFARQQRNIRSYPKGYDVSDLGTFPDRCPVPRD
jgi:uncharacterized protein (DUF2236 family)